MESIHLLFLLVKREGERLFVHTYSISSSNMLQQQQQVYIEFV